MRHAILALPTFLFIACSSGGAGNPTVGTPGGFGDEGSSIPVFPAGGGPTGSNPGGGQHDTGTVENQDTGGGTQDTGTAATDTGGTSPGDEAICAAKCPSDPATPSSVISSCLSSMMSTMCAAEYRAFWTCRQNNRVCTADGTTDSAATQTACQSEQDAISACAG